MELYEISEDLKMDAVDLGLCAEWTLDWGVAESKEELVEKYVKGIDFCIKHNYPNLAYMKNFDGVRQKYGVFVAEPVKAFNLPFLDMNHECSGKVSNDGITVTRGFVRGESKVDIVAMGMSAFHISLYDNSEVNIRCYDDAKVYIYRFGGSIETNGHKGIYIREKTVD